MENCIFNKSSRKEITHTNCQFKMSKNVGEKLGKLYFQCYKYKRGMTPTFVNVQI